MPVTGNLGLRRWPLFGREAQDGGGGGVKVMECSDLQMKHIDNFGLLILRVYWRDTYISFVWKIYFVLHMEKCIKYVPANVPAETMRQFLLG
jgi:hypothetical protein